MGNFYKLFKYVNNTFLYKFKVISENTNELKMYGISPDNIHTYISIVKSKTNSETHALIGNFTISLIDSEVIELEPDFFFNLPINERAVISKYINNLSMWDMLIIKKLLNKNSEDLIL